MSKIKQFCVSCGNSIEVDTEKEKNFCPHCGEQIINFITRDNSSINSINIDNVNYVTSLIDKEESKSFFEKKIYFIIIAILTFLIFIFSFVKFGEIKYYNKELTYSSYAHQWKYTYTSRSIYVSKFFDPGESFVSILSLIVFIHICLLLIFCIFNLFLKKGNKRLHIIESISSITISILGIILCIYYFIFIKSYYNGVDINTIGFDNYAIGRFTSPVLFYIFLLFIAVLTLATIKFTKLMKSLKH